MRMWLGPTILLGTMLFLGLAAMAAAQEREVIMQPVAGGKAAPTAAGQPTLQDAIFAKVTSRNGKKQVVFLVETFRDEQVLAEVARAKQEQKTREVINAAGETIEETYKVWVPIIVEEEVTTRVPAGKKPVEVSIQVCNFYNLDNDGVSDVEAEALLLDSRPVLLLDNRQGRPKELDPRAKELLRPDCLIVVTEELIREPRRRR